VSRRSESPSVSRAERRVQRKRKSYELTKNQAKQIRALKRMRDEDIDFMDIPEKTDWSGAVAGQF
jgi:DNA-binding PadR family transcriptional regulator